jgi:hypothetical protein
MASGSQSSRINAPWTSSFTNGADAPLMGSTHGGHDRSIGH